jgi:hypothetical protein
MYLDVLVDRAAKIAGGQLLELFLHLGLTQRLVHIGIDLVDDVFRRFGRRHDAVPGDRFKARKRFGIVGTFGSAGRRSDEATASSFSLPA